MKSKILLMVLFLFSAGMSYGQRTQPGRNITEAAEPQGKTIVFRFVAEDDTFFIPYQGNGDKLTELVATIDHYKGAITNGQAKINVAGYCSSYATSKENIASAVIRANRVKSELILRNGIKEEHFATTVHSTSFEGRKSVVVVTLRVPQISEPVKPQPIVEQAKPEPVVEAKPEAKPEPVVEPEPVIIELHTSPHSTKPVPAWDSYRFALRTNLLYDAFLIPNLGLEWRINPQWGVKVEAGGSNWGKSSGKVQKLWYVNPELRYYMGNNKRFYVGASGNYGKYNIYKGMLGNVISKDTGYQGSMWNAGATVGYQLPLGRSFALDFNLGLGYNSFEYDSFGITDGVRVYKGKDQTKNLWGPTQAGISLVWVLPSTRR